MRMRFLTLFVFIVCFIVFRLVFSADIGSDTAVTRFNTQQTVNDGDRIAGFAALDAGFLLTGATVEGTFDSFFPVSGVVDFNFGTLSLSQDLILHNVSSIGHQGNINGNGHIFELSESVRCIPSETGSDICTVTFTFDDIHEDSVNSVHFSFDSLYLTEGAGDELYVDLVVNENFLQIEDELVLARDILSVNWHPSKDFIAVGMTAGTGDELFTYTFDRSAGTLALIDGVDLGGVGNSVNSVAWHPDGDHLAVASDANANEVLVYEIDSAGNFGASTSVSFSPNANVVAWSADGTFLAVGTAQSGLLDELRIYSFVKSPLGISLDASFDVGLNVNTIAWNKSASANGELVIGVPTGANRLRLFRHDGAGSLVELTTGLSVGTAVQAVAWVPDGTCIIAGLQNNAEGTGGELRVYGFNSDDTLTQEDDIEFGDDVITVDASPNGRLLATGDDGIGAADPSTALFRFDADFVSTSEVTWDSLNIVMNGNTTFDFTAIRFTGECSIDGHGCIVSFSPTFSMIIDSNASLLFKNITLAGINSTKLQLADVTSTVSFQKISMSIDDDFFFSTGCFEVLDECIIRGDHKFIYQSPCTSIIHGHLPSAGGGECQSGHSGALIMDHNTTFSYDSIISSTLISMHGEYAKFIFNSATLAVTSSLLLTEGRLFFDGKCNLLCGDGLLFGDGTEAGKLYVELLPAAQVDVVSGFLIDNSIQ